MSSLTIFALFVSFCKFVRWRHSVISFLSRKIEVKFEIKLHIGYSGV